MKTAPMKTAGGIATVVLALFVVAGCASTRVTQDENNVANEKIPRPDRILVYDFVASSDEVAPDSALAGAASAQPAPTPEQREQARAAGAAVASALVADIDAMGIPALRASRDTVPDLDDVVIRGYFASIDAGSATKRLLVGFGSGASELKTVVEIYQMTTNGLRKLGSGSVSSGGGKGPGAAVPAAVAIATANPIGLIVTSAVKVGTEVSGSSTLEGRAKATAKEIAAELKPRMQKRGWIQ